MSNQDLIDVLIVGGGIGGITLAQWLTGLGRSWRIVERDSALGGALKNSDYALKWIPALPDVSGRQYLAQMRAGIDQQYCWLNTEVAAINIADRFHCQLSCGLSIQAKKIVFACGASPYSPFAATERIIVGAGLEQFNAIKPGARIAVLGGGDNALEHALLLHQRGCTVELYVRNELRASAAFLSQLQQTPIKVHTQCQNLNPVAVGEYIQLGDELYDYACVYYGYQPSPILKQFPQLLLTDSSPVEGVYTIGDMTQPKYPNILLTQGQAAQLAKQLDADL
jgi:thioredoxin reductase